MNKEFRGNHKKQAQNNGLNASCCSVLIPSRNLSRSRIFLASGESNSCRFKTPLVIIIQLYYYHLWLWWKRPKTRSDQIENSWQWLYNRITSIYSTICKSSYLIYINLLKVAWILAFVLEILKWYCQSNQIKTGVKCRLTNKRQIKDLKGWYLP